MSLDLKKYLAEGRELIDKLLNDFLPAKDVFPSKVHEAMRYSLFAGGKRIRPILCLAAAEACKGTRREVLPIACALEMIHTFSLIHDDLPAMDDDDFRRGNPTNHKVYGEATAILSGDGLVVQAFVALSKLHHSHSHPQSILEVIHDISLATGSLGMIGGQIVDMESEGQKITLDELRTLHSLKTGRLIAVSVTSGAKMATTDDTKRAALEHYGKQIGLAFQIADDILDIEGGEELGKDIGSDAANNKATYPSLMGLEEAKKEGQKVIAEALGALKNFGPEADALREIANFIINRKS